MICLTIPGQPIAQPRYKVSRKTGRLFIAKLSDGSPHPIHNWKAEIVSAARRVKINEPMDGPIQMCVFFHIKRPDSHLKKNGGLRKSKHHAHIQKPDLDNLVKAVKDAISDSGNIWHDDCQVVKTHAEKLWTTRFPFAQVLLREAEVRCETQDHDQETA